MRALIMLMLLAATSSPGTSQARGQQRRERSLAAVARRSLESNIIDLRSGPYLCAGGHQFHSLWTRDFAFAARGLFKLRRFDVVRNQLEKLLAAARPEDGLVPRTLDSLPVALRVLSSTAANLVGRRAGLPVRDNLKPQYIDEHGSPAIDSNLLVLLTSLDYVRESGDLAFWRRNERHLVRAFRFYDQYLDGGLIEQPKYSDWQDSVKRQGKTFYTNLLYYTVARRLADKPAFGVRAGNVEALRQRIERTFRDEQTGLYRSLAGEPWLSLDGNLLAIDLGFCQGPGKERALYEGLKQSELWRRHGLPGFNTTPDYPRSWAHLSARLAGLSHYHDRIFWSWLMALSAKVAGRVGDTRTERRLLRVLSGTARRDGAITEIFAPKPDLPAWRSLLYASEAPFSWGAGMVIDALAAKAAKARDQAAR